MELFKSIQKENRKTEVVIWTGKMRIRLQNFTLHKKRKRWQVSTTMVFLNQNPKQLCPGSRSREKMQICYLARKPVLWRSTCLLWVLMRKKKRIFMPRIINRWHMIFEYLLTSKLCPYFTLSVGNRQHFWLNLTAVIW